MATSEALIQTTVRHQVLLERLKSGEVNRFTKFLKQIDSDLKERLLNDDLTNFSRTRLERLLVEVENALSGVLGEFQQELGGGLSDLAEYEAGFEAASIDDALESFESVVPASSQVRAAIFSAPLSVRGAGGGKLLEPFIADWSAGEKTRIIGAIRQGVFEGQTNFQIIQAIRGTRANKYTDGILATTSRNAEAIVRTAVQHVSSVARFETWQENKAVVKGYKWVSTLDGRTSTQCRSLDGQVFKLGKGPKPPIHIRCRSTTVAELDERFNFLKEGAQRASKDGPINSNQTYYEWLKTQSSEFQDEVLGKTRAKLFREGGLSAERFAALNLHRNFTPMTLEEMKKKEPLAFSKITGKQAAKSIKKAPVNELSFKESKTISEAQSYLIDNKLAKTVDFGKIDISVANEINQSLFEHGRDYPELIARVNFIGSAQSLNRRSYNALYAANLNRLKENYPDRSDDWYERYAKRYTKRPKTGREWAFARGRSYNPALEGLDGVAFNEKYSAKKGLDSLKDGLKRSLDSEFHPIGADTVKSIMDHELGHQLDYMLGLSEDNEIIQALRSWGGDKSTLSGYARTNIAEFIAEAWAEYRNNPSPRPVAARVGRLIDERYKARFRRD